jgi:Ca2+-binding RTX toxin-like protein
LSIADLNGDGALDLVAGNYGNDTFSVLLGNGDGTFQPQTTFTAGAGAYDYGIQSMATADVNGDGKVDVIVGNNLNYNVTVMLGNGGGTFQPQKVFATGNNPNSVAVADLNGDGKLDIVTANTSDGTVSLLLGNGDGTFQPQKSFAAGPVTTSAALGDVNGDGKVDVVATNYTGGVSVLLGHGDGTFEAPQSYQLPQYTRYVALGDLNGDGNTDIVTSGGDGTNVLSILLGNGDGTFQSPQTISDPRNPYSLTLADMNGDNAIDMVVADRDASEVSIYLGNGDGTFQPQQSFTVGSGPVPVRTADLNGDGVPDLVAGNYEGLSVSIWLSDAIAPTVAITTQALLHDTGISSNDWITSDGHLTLTGTVSDNNSVSGVHIFDGATDLGAATVNGNSWSFTSDLAAGTHNLSAVATDVAGNHASVPESFTIVIDETAPASAITNMQVSSNGGVTLAGTTAEANDTIAVYDGTTLLGTTTTASDGSWSFSPRTSKSVVDSYTVTATDVAGNVGTGSNKAIIGTQKADALFGSSGNDIVNGSQGNDTITGGLGADKLTGGSGKDTFVYNSALESRPTGYDTIMDFTHGQDQFDFTNISGITSFQGQLNKGSGNFTLNPHSIGYLRSGDRYKCRLFGSKHGFCFGRRPPRSIGQ